MFSETFLLKINFISRHVWPWDCSKGEKTVKSEEDFCKAEVFSEQRIISLQEVEERDILQTQ